MFLNQCLDKFNNNTHVLKFNQFFYFLRKVSNSTHEWKRNFEDVYVILIGCCT